MDDEDQVETTTDETPAAIADDAAAAVEDVKEAVAAADMSSDDRGHVDSRVAELEAEIAKLKAQLEHDPLAEDDDDEPEEVAAETATEPTAGVETEPLPEEATRRSNSFRKMIRRRERH